MGTCAEIFVFFGTKHCQVWGICIGGSVWRTFTPNCAVVFIIIGARSASLDDFRTVPGSTHLANSTVSRGALRRLQPKWLRRGLHVKQLALEAVWLLFLSDNGSYLAILFASHQWFGEQPYSWKRLRIQAGHTA